MKLTLEQWTEQFKEQESCRHSIFGACSFPCPDCGVYGFYGVCHVDERKYVVCKWCGNGCDVGGEPFQCKYEICRKCFPEKEFTNFTRKEIGSRDSQGFGITQQPGHPCPTCETKMAVYTFEVHPLKAFKDELYEIHMYEEPKE